VIVLDTNVVSELVKPQPDPAVRAWVNGRPAETMFVTAITEAEMLFGVSLMADGRRRNALRLGILTVFGTVFASRILPFDSAAATEYGDWAADRRRKGRPVGIADLQIAAIARVRGATTIATRNAKDFGDCGIPVADPWLGP